MSSHGFSCPLQATTASQPWPLPWKCFQTQPATRQAYNLFSLAAPPPAPPRTVEVVSSIQGPAPGGFESHKNLPNPSARFTESAFSKCLILDCLSTVTSWAPALVSLSYRLPYPPWLLAPSLQNANLIMLLSFKLFINLSLFFKILFI